MAGTKEGAVKTRAKILERDPDHYKKIGKIGGHNGHTGGFASSRDLAVRAGRKGGCISSKAKNKMSIELRREKYINKRFKQNIYCEMAVDASENLDITL